MNAANDNFDNTTDLSDHAHTLVGEEVHNYSGRKVHIRYAKGKGQSLTFDPHHGGVEDEVPTLIKHYTVRKLVCKMEIEWNKEQHGMEQRSTG